MSEARLVDCFAAVFPAVPVADLPGASVTTLSDWDSLHAVVLIAVLEETFAIRIPPRDYPGLRSYRAVRDYLGLGAGG